MPCHGSVYCDICLLPIDESLRDRRREVLQISEEVYEKIKWINKDTCTVDQGFGSLMHCVECRVHNKYHGMYWENCFLLHKTCYDFVLKMSSDSESKYYKLGLYKENKFPKYNDNVNYDIAVAYYYVKKYHDRIKDAHPITDWDHFSHMYLLCWELFGEERRIDAQGCHFDQFKDNLDIFFDPKMPENTTQRARFDKIFKDIFRNIDD